MDLRSEINALVQAFEDERDGNKAEERRSLNAREMNVARVCGAYADAQDIAVGRLRNILASNPLTGFDVWLSADAPNFKVWRKTAWFEVKPDAFVIMGIDKAFHPVELYTLCYTDADNIDSYRVEDKERDSVVIRRYVVIPAGSPAPTTQEVT